MGHTAPTKKHTEIWNGYTLTAGTGVNRSSVIDLSTSYGADLIITLNGGAGDTAEPNWQFEVSPDNSNWYNFGGKILGFGQFSGGAWGNWSQSYSIHLPMGVPYVRITINAHAWGNAWDVTAHISEVI